MPANKILDTNALYAIRDYINSYSGKVDDVQISGTSILSNKVANIAVDGTYNSSTNKVATKSTVTNAIGALDGVITGSAGAGKTLTAFSQTDGKVTATFGDISIASSKISDITNSYSSTGEVAVTGKAIAAALGTLDGSITGSAGAAQTLTAFSEADGKVSATFGDIAIAESQVTNLITDLGNKVPTSRTIAGLQLNANISAASLVSALGLSSALNYIGVTTTTKPTAGNYVQTVIGTTTYYVSLTSSGTATQVNAVKGQVLSLGTTGKEYVCTTGGASGTNVFTELGDESSFALKSITITGTGALGGGGTLEANRTITHNTGNAASKASGFYKFSTDAYSHVNSVTAVAKSDLTGLGVADNSLVVHLAGDETITGTKTFGTASFASATATSLVATALGATALAIDASGYISFSQSSTIIGKLQKATLTESRTWTLPDKTGTIAMTSDIPSVSNFVTLDGTQTITGAKTFSAATTVSGNLSVGGTTSVGQLSATSLIMSTSQPMKNASSHSYGLVLPNTTSYTANRTIATMSDIPSLTGYAKLQADQTFIGTQKFKSASGSSYALVIPTTTGYTADRTIATTSDLASHTGDTTIHVTSANKTTWNDAATEVATKIGALSWELVDPSSSTGDEYYVLKYGVSTANKELLAAMSYDEAKTILMGS